MLGQRSPARRMAANLMWTRTGSVYAIWRLTGLSYGFRPEDHKDYVRTVHRALFRALPGESMLLGIQTGIDPMSVVDRMLEGIDEASHPDWVEECLETLDTLGEYEPGKRQFFLVVPLGARRAWEYALEPARAGLDSLRELAALPVSVIGDDEVQWRLAQAQRIQDAIPLPLRPEPATVAQMVWLQQHAMTRGSGLDYAPALELAAGGGKARSGAVMPEPLLDEGGKTDLSRKERKKSIRAKNQFVKVMDADAPGNSALSYQSLLVIQDMPPEDLVWPGSEFMGDLDSCGLDVDWAMRLDVRSSASAAADNRKALIKLNDQLKQREGEETAVVMSELERNYQALADYVALLAEDPNEVETQPTFIFAVAGQTGAEATSNAAALTAHFTSMNFRIVQPLGFQRALWWSMIPGVAASRVVRDFAQLTTADKLAGCMPLASAELGDDSGPLFGLNITIPGARPGVVHYNVANATKADVSGSIGVIAELGAGKTVFMMKVAGDLCAIGGQYLTADRTSTGEWARFAGSITGAQVVDASDPKQSACPIAMFGPEEGAPVARAFVTTLLRIRHDSDECMLIRDVLSSEYLIEHDLGHLGDVLTHLESGDCTVEGPVKKVARALRAVARERYGKAMFDASLPVLDPDAPAIVFRTHKLALPDKTELENAHQSAEMTEEKIFGRAFYGYLAGLARLIGFSNPDRPFIFGVDECYHVTNSPEGGREILLLVRDGRKHNSYVLMGGHDPEDLGDETIRGLIKIRLLMRQTDGNLARKGLAWLDQDPEDEDLVALIRGLSPATGEHGEVPVERRGEAMMRDAQGSIGLLKVLLPSTPARAKAVLTWPAEESPDPDGSRHKTAA